MFLWWTGWFGGVDLPSYSTIAPVIMSWTGVTVAAAAAAVAAVAAAHWLFRGTTRPASGLAVFGAAVFVNLVCGRATFAVGFAGLVVSLSFLKSRRAILSCLIGVFTCLASPLAGLFLGLAALTVAVTDASRRRAAIVLALVLGGVGLLLAMLVPGAGRMPFPWWHLVLAVSVAAIVATICPQHQIRAGCVIVAAASVVFFAEPAAVGTNMVRIEWLAAAAVAVACADLSRIRLVVMATLLSAWPLADLGVQLADAGNATASPAFYRPLLSALTIQQAQVGTSGIGERVEVVDSASQWSAAYVAPRIAIARGWDRQVDRADNPLFYDGRLTASTYQQWLFSLAVGWVALPTTGALDYASVAEGRLIRRGLGYLRLVWQNPDWRLYRVQQARPLIVGAMVKSVGSAGVTFSAVTAGSVRLQLRWSPYLTLTTDGHSVAGCIASRGPWTTVGIPKPGTYTVAARLSVASAGSNAACPSSPN